MCVYDRGEESIPTIFSFVVERSLAECINQNYVVEKSG